MAEGTPLERVQVVNSGARVQIPPSALMERNEKKFLTSEKTRDKINELRLTKSCQKEMKKVLDNSRLDVIRYQSCCKRETKTTSKKLKKVLDRQETT